MATRRVAAALALLATGCAHHIEQVQVKSALVKAGLSPPMAQCLAHRLVDQLTVRQLRKLQALQGPKRNIDDYLAAVQRVNDPQAIQVTIASAVFCGSAHPAGYEPESR